jgi:hypothetical protein
LFDILRQEPISIADYRSVAGVQPYMVGSPWGAALNSRFDSEFVSTVPHNFDWVAAGYPSRPNRFLELFTPESVPAATLANLRDEDQSARFQLIRGAFNINSSSIDAWEAVLGNAISGWNYQSGTINLDNAFFRTPHNARAMGNLDTSISPLPESGDLGTLFADASEPEFRAVGRQISDAQVRDLATQIVTAIKARPQPFRSLGEFVNYGLLQTAIENVPGINAGVPAGQRFTSFALTQPDVLALIAPFMAARSDTFRIRTYADVKNPVTGEITARAWCEAVVQRIPDLAENATAAVGDVFAADPATFPFGRRFVVTSFRWLTPEDI